MNNKKELSGKFQLLQNNVLRHLVSDEGLYIKQVIYKKPYTIVFWNDDTKTFAKTFEGDQYNCETGLLICVMKKLYGRDAIVDLMRDWVPNSQEEIVDGEYIKVTQSDVRKKHIKMMKIGYRLEVRSTDSDKCKSTFYGTKLYGYLPKEEYKHLSSYNYLINIGKIDADADPDILFDYCSNNEIVLDNNQFRKFITLYDIDYNNFLLNSSVSINWVLNDSDFYGKCYDLTRNQDIIDLLNSNDSVIISWRF